MSRFKIVFSSVTGGGNSFFVETETLDKKEEVAEQIEELLGSYSKDEILAGLESHEHPDMEFRAVHSEQDGDDEFVAANLLSIEEIDTGVVHEYDPPINTHIEQLRAMAEDGEAGEDVYYELGEKYWFGDDVEQDDKQAIKWFRASAERSEPWGLFALGRCYELGRGVAANEEEAFRYYKESYEIDEDSPARAALARCYSGGVGVEENTEKAIEILREAAETGDREAQWRLGFLYSGIEEFGVTNVQEAVKWYRLAADQGDELSLSWLATAYQTGEGVEQDDEEAFKLLRKLVEVGDDEGILRLAECYLTGCGVAQNFDEAFMGFFDYWGVVDDLSDCFNWMFEFADQQDVLDWIQAGIDGGDNDFLIGLAGSYEMGVIDATDEESKTITEKLYRQAAQLGDKSAQENFAEMVFEDFREQGGEFGEKQQEALSYLREAAENGDRGQQFFLANLYLDGIGVEQNKEKAFKLYLSAAKDDRYTGLHSMNALSDCYRDGTGVEKNVEEAEKWAAKAKVLEAELDAKMGKVAAEEGDDESDDD